MSIWSPHDIEVLLFHYYSPSDQPWRHGDTPAYRDSVADLQSHGLIDRADFPFVTDKGKALIDMWCAQPVPTAVFVDPRFAALTDTEKR